jgi:hypothetical protein
MPLLPTGRLPRMGAIGVNLALRLVIVGVVADALLNPEAARYAGKGIGTRGLVLVAASLVIPALYRFGRRRPYPIWTDNLYLSVFAVDMGGNLLDLYDRYIYFDLIPHAHGTGAVTVVLSELLPVGVLGATGIAQAAHILLEAQEYYSDVLFNLRNVRGTWDTINDLLAGLAGSAVYGAVYALGRRWIGQSRRSSRSRTARPRGDNR